MINATVGSPPLLAIAFFAACIFGQLVEVAQSQSQNKTQPPTDPVEGVPLSLSLSLSLLWIVGLQFLAECSAVFVYMR